MYNITLTRTHTREHFDFNPPTNIQRCDEIQCNEIGRRIWLVCHFFHVHCTIVKRAQLCGHVHKYVSLCFVYVCVVYIFSKWKRQCKSIASVESVHPNFPFLHEVRMRTEHIQLLRLIRKHNSKRETQNTVIAEPFEMCVCTQKFYVLCLCFVNAQWIVFGSVFFSFFSSVNECNIHSLTLFCFCLFYAHAVFTFL